MCRGVVTGGWWYVENGVVVTQREAGMDVKIGDVVHVRATVQDVSGSHGFCVKTQDGAHMYAANREIVHVEPRALAVGDRATIPGYRVAGEILAINGKRAWMKWPNDEHTTRYLEDLVRA